MSDCKYPSAMVFDRIEADLPNLFVENVVEEMKAHELDLFNELRGRFIRTKREWPMCEVHGAVRLFPRVARDHNKGKVVVHLIFGCRDFILGEYLATALGDQRQNWNLDDLFFEDGQTGIAISNPNHDTPSQAGDGAGVAGPRGS